MSRYPDTGRFSFRASFFLRQLLVLFVLLVISASSLFAQSKPTTTYRQFWNEFAFTKPLKGKVALELNLGQSWTSTPEHKGMFSTNSQLYVRAWAHYYHSSRWKFSGFLAYYYNKDVPEINQRKAPEIRTSVQTQYFFRKIPYTLNARFRIEDRKILSDENIWEATYRFRLQMRCVYPINNKFITGGTFYALGSDELMFKSGSLIAGTQFFDRNRLTLGGGYAFTDDLQLEVTYANEFLPRTDSKELYHAFQVNAVFNNFLSNLKKKFFHKKALEPINSD